MMSKIGTVLGKKETEVSSHASLAAVEHKITDATGGSSNSCPFLYHHLASEYLRVADGF